MTRVLVVDDEPQILRALRINLKARQYDVVTATTGHAALRLASEIHPDLVVLDLGLPDMDGVEIVRSLRSWSATPILILSGRLNSAAKVQALDAGADDYVTKPFNIEELFARVRAVTRRTADEHDEPVAIGGWLVDLVRYRVRRSEDDVGERATEEVHLTKTEWQLLRALLRQPGRLVSQRQLLQEVWGPAYTEEAHYLRQYMKTLRRKLEPDPTRPRYLLTEAGMGYRFQP